MILIVSVLLHKSYVLNHRIPIVGGIRMLVSLPILILVVALHKKAVPNHQTQNVGGIIIPVLQIGGETMVVHIHKSYALNRRILLVHGMERPAFRGNLNKNTSAPYSKGLIF